MHVMPKKGRIIQTGRYLWSSEMDAQAEPNISKSGNTGWVQQKGNGMTKGLTHTEWIPKLVELSTHNA